MDYRKKNYCWIKRKPSSNCPGRDIFFKSLKNLFGKKYFNKLEQKFFKTSGDKFLEKKISTLGNKGLFTKEIDEAQLNLRLTLVFIHLRIFLRSYLKD